jgi:hypothetical protein
MITSTRLNEVHYKFQVLLDAINEGHVIAISDKSHKNKWNSVMENNGRY